MRFTWGTRTTDGLALPSQHSSLQMPVATFCWFGMVNKLRIEISFYICHGVNT